MLEDNIENLDEETQQRLKKNPLAMLAYQILGPPAPEPLFKSKEEYDAAAEKLRKELAPKFEKLRIAAAKSWVKARYHIID